MAKKEDKRGKLIIDDGLIAPKSGEADVSISSGECVTIYRYSDSGNKWICRYCECENTMDTNRCCVCMKNR